jgi:hypothetical protein
MLSAFPAERRNVEGDIYAAARESSPMIYRAASIASRGR